jgi:arylsulfatase A
MTRRAFLSSMAMEAVQKRPPNVLFILADDLGASAVGCYGNTLHRTPHVDSMAARGVRFETCYATPLCSPTRVMLMTGRYGFRTGFTNFIGRVTTRVERLSADEYTLADMFKAAGYATGLAGKWQLGLASQHPTMISDSGFDEYFAWAWKEGGLPADAKFEGSERQRYWHPAIVSNGKHVPTTPSDYGPHLYSDWIIDFMRRNRERPFFAYYPMALVHEPWEPTPDLAKPGAKTKGGFKNNVEYMDHIVGKLFRALDELRLADNTIVFFCGDNGTGKDGKGTVTEAGVRVPLIAAGPGVVKGKVSRDLVSLVDVLPTLAEWTGATYKGPGLDGVSFAPQLRGERGQPREWIFSYLGYERMLRDRRWLLEGDGKFFDCGEARDGVGYKDVSASKDAEVMQAKARFARILEKLPAPPAEKK